MPLGDSHPYSGREVVLTTKHEKLALIAPIMEAEIGLRLVLHAGDTDQFGTFTGEIERTLSPQEAVIAKAKLGMSDRGASLGIASEGSIGPDPMMPFTRSDIEYIALVDLDRDIEIVERYRSLQITAGEMITEPGYDISSFLAKVDFPNHKLIAKPNKANIARTRKGIGDVGDLEKAIEELSAQSKDGKVMLQSDLRAHCSPSRQQNIIQVTQLLANRVKALCPSCESPGFGVTSYERGLDCSECGEWIPTAPKFQILACVKCSFVKRGPQLATLAEPSSCNGCNP